MPQDEQKPPDRKLSGDFAIFGEILGLYHFCHHLTHGDCYGVLCLSGGVRVGVECEASVVVTQHGGNGLHIHTVLQRCCRECMSEFMKFQVWKSRILQNFFVDVYHRVWMVHLAGNGRWEEVGTVGMFAVLRDEQVNGLLRDGHQPDRVFCFRLGEDAFSVGVAHILLTDGDRIMSCVYVAPERRNQFSFTQSADQFQIEHGQGIPLSGGLQIDLDAFQGKYVHFHFSHFWRDAVVSGVALDEPFFDSPLEGTVKHQMEAVHRGAAEPGSAFEGGMNPPVFLKIPVQLLKVTGGKFTEFLSPMRGMA